MTTPANLLRVTTPIELKRAPQEPDGTVSGYASTFGGPPDVYGHVIEPGAFQASLQKFAATGTAPLMLWGHDPDRPVGRWTTFAEDQHGLKVRGAFNLDTSNGRDAYGHVKGGDLNGLSIGYVTLPGGKRAGPNGTTILSAIDFLEISILAFPANSNARVSSVKSAFGSRDELKSILREHLPGRAVEKLLSGGWPAVSGDEGGDDEKTELEIKSAIEVVKAARAELQKGKFL
jgi:HK97 family phage prohead protease